MTQVAGCLRPPILLSVKRFFFLRFFRNVIAEADPQCRDEPLSPAADSHHELRQLREEVAVLVEAGMGLKEAAELAGLSLSEYRHPSRACYVPLPETIERMCREFRDGWSATERKRRWVHPAPDRRTAPVIAARKIVGDAAA